MTSAVLRAGLRGAVLRLGRELRRLVDRRAADRRAVGRGAAARPRRRPRPRRSPIDDDRRRRSAGMSRWLAEQRAVLAGGDEVDADRVLPRIAARAILDLQQVAVVLVVALHGHRARRRRQRLRRAPSSLSLSAKYSRSRAGREQRLDDLARMAAALDRPAAASGARSSAAAASRARRRRSRRRRPASARRALRPRAGSGTPRARARP